MKLRIGIDRATMFPFAGEGVRLFARRPRQSLPDVKMFVCPGCGRRVEYSEVIGANFVRERSTSRASGRVSFTVGGIVAHQCSDGEYLPSGRNARPRR